MSVSERILYAIQHPNSKRKGDLILYQGSDKKEKEIAPKTLLRYIRSNPKGTHKIFISGETIKGVWVENKWRNAKTIPVLHRLIQGEEDTREQHSSSSKEDVQSSEPVSNNLPPKLVKPDDFPELQKVRSRLRYMSTVLTLDSIPYEHRMQAGHAAREIKDFLRNWNKYGLDWNDSESNELTKLFELFDQLPEEVLAKIIRSIQKIVELVEDFEENNTTMR